MDEYPAPRPEQEKQIGDSDRPVYPSVLGNDRLSEEDTPDALKGEEESRPALRPGQIGYDPRPVSPPVLSRSERVMRSVSEETENHEDEKE